VGWVGCWEVYREYRREAVGYQMSREYRREAVGYQMPREYRREVVGWVGLLLLLLHIAYSRFAAMAYIHNPVFPASWP
jgi:hypothetical protein